MERLVRGGAVTIYEYEAGVLYRHGRFERLLPPGRHRLWPFSGRSVVVVDTRQATVTVPNQKLLTVDPVTVTLTVTADHRVADPVPALHRVLSWREQLYGDVQHQARAVVAGATLDELLKERTGLGLQVLERLRPLAAQYGVEVAAVGIRDVILPPNVRDLVMKEVEARRLAQAALVGAREEVATLRALANAARMVRDQPEILRLRELDVLREAARRGGTLVLGTSGTLRPGRAADPAEEDPTP